MGMDYFWVNLFYGTPYFMSHISKYRRNILLFFDDFSTLNTTLLERHGGRNSGRLACGSDSFLGGIQCVICSSPSKPFET